MTRSAPNGLKIKFDPPFDAPGSGLASARRNNILRRVREAITIFFWKLGQNEVFNIKLNCGDRRFCGTPATSKASMSAPNGPKIKFDPPFDAPGSGLSSARRIYIVRQTREAMATFFWKLVQNGFFSSNSNCRNLGFWCFQRLYDAPDRPQMVQKQSLTHHSTRQGQCFPAHVESTSYDKHTRLWQLFSEIGAKQSLQCPLKCHLSI